jgi:hypothetical protein
MDHNRTVQSSAAMDQQTGRSNVSHFADANSWQQPPMPRHSNVDYQQQYNSYPQSQYAPALPHYTHQVQSSPNANMSVYSTGANRYLPPQSKANNHPFPSSSASPQSSNKAYPSSAGYDYQNSGAFASSGFSETSSSENNLINSHEEENNSTAVGQVNQLNLGPSPLRRGQACANCRKRKLKCDAVRPVCGTCTRSRKAAASANHPSPIVDGDCVYDDAPMSSGPSVRGQSTAISEKGRRVSNAKSNLAQGSGVQQEGSSIKATNVNSSSNKRRKTIGDDDFRSPPAWDSPPKQKNGFAFDPLPGETVQQRSQRLENRIRELEGMLREKSPAPIVTHKEETERRPSTSGPTVSIFSLLSPSSGKEERYRMQYSQRPAHHPVGSNLQHESSQDVKASLFDMSTDSIEIDRDEQIRNELAQGHCARDDPILQLLWPGWSNDLPSPDTVLTICETFFRQHPMRSLVYKPSFMSGLSLPPNHPHRPHDSLIHAILATTADISPFFQGRGKDTQDRFVMLLSDARSRPGSEQSLQPISNAQVSFKEFHLRKAREKVELSLITEFRNPLDWIAACLLSCFTLWSSFRITESYFLSAILARACSPAGLDKLPSRHLSNDLHMDRVPGLFGQPEGVEEQERRMTFWHIFISDMYTGGPPQFYENLLSEASIFTHLPCAVVDFQAGKDVAPNPQTLTSPDLFRSGHIDDFTLHIKSAVLVRRACTLQCRNQLTKKKPTGLAVVDKQITEFIDSFPPFDFEHPDQISVDKLTAWNNIWLALFHLHETYLTPTSIAVRENDSTANYSNKRVSLAVDKVLGMIHYLMNSSFDFALIHPQTYLVWSVCARMLGKEMDLLKRGGMQGEQALQQVMEKLHWVVLALERAGEKNLKARRCSELVSYVKSGTMNEGILSQLLYTDGVIPTGDDENTPSTSSMPSTMNGDTSSLEALMMSTTGHPHDGKDLLPHDFGMTEQRDFHNGTDFLSEEALRRIIQPSL